MLGVKFDSLNGFYRLNFAGIGAAMTVNLPFLATNLERDTQNYTANNQN